MSGRNEIARWGHLRFIDVPRYRSPYFFPTASAEGSMSRLSPTLRGKDARLAMMGGAFLSEQVDLDEDDDFGLDGDLDDLDEALGALPPRQRRVVLGAVQRAIYAAEEAEQAAATAQRSANRTKKAIRPFASVSKLFERKGGESSRAEKAIVEARRLFAPPPVSPPAPVVVAPLPPEKKGLGVGAMVGIGVAVLALGVGAGVMVARAGR